MQQREDGTKDEFCKVCITHTHMYRELPVHGVFESYTLFALVLFSFWDYLGSIQV